MFLVSKRTGKNPQSSNLGTILIYDFLGKLSQKEAWLQNSPFLARSLKKKKPPRYIYIGYYRYQKLVISAQLQDPPLTRNVTAVHLKSR